MTINIVATGHQPDKLGFAKDDPNVMKGIQVALPVVKQRLNEIIGAHPARIYIGMAQGFDLLVGGAALQLRQEDVPIEVIGCYPYPNFGAHWKDKLARTWQEKIHAKAFDAFTVCNQIPNNDREARMLLNERNEYMVREVLSLGDPWCFACSSGIPSGAGRTIAMFEKKGDSDHVVNVYDAIKIALTQLQGGKH